MSDVSIRSATIHDIPVILAFIKELSEYEKLAHEVVATEEMLQDSLFGPRSNIEVLLAYIDNIPVGFAIFFHNFSSFLGRSGIYLEDLFVKPDVRGKGIGEKLLVHLAKLAKLRKCGRLEWSVLDWNEPAINFYKKLGAKPMDEWTVFRVSGSALDQLASKDP